MGNTVFTTDYLNRVLGMKKGDVYNQKLLGKRLSEDEDAVGNNYWNDGYLFYNLQPTEVNIVGDSIDLEMRIFEGQQAHISRVRINGNTRLYENRDTSVSSAQSQATSSRRMPCSVLPVSSHRWDISTRSRYSQT